MDAAPPTAPLTRLQRLTHPKTLAAMAAGLAVAALGTAGWWRWWLKPQRDIAEKRFETMQDISRLFGLQLQYQSAKGVYANDLETLLTLAPDREAFKARMASHLDMATIAVVGDAQKFKVEANVLDPERTLIKIKGPVETQRKADPTALPEASSGAGPDEGAPVASPPAR